MVTLLGKTERNTEIVNSFNKNNFCVILRILFQKSSYRKEANR